MTPEQKAERARATLEAWADAFSAIRERHLAAFENSAPADTAAREQAHAMLRAITQLRAEMHSAIDDEAIKKGRHRGSD
ncbi:hypothetical protein HGG71_11565 [Rhodobacteraceae bacterium R_SAG2]|nr:hypothetical protein [Rhodobacteraceae bacterium R_SAG2]